MLGTKVYFSAVPPYLVIITHLHFTCSKAPHIVYMIRFHQPLILLAYSLYFFFLFAIFYFYIIYSFQRIVNIFRFHFIKFSYFHFSFLKIVVSSIYPFFPSKPSQALFPDFPCFHHLQ